MTARKPRDTEKAVEKDWKMVAYALAERVNFAISRLDVRGSGMMVNMKTGKARSWRDYMADGLRMMPGWKVDRRVLDALELPAAKRRKRLAELAAARHAAALKGKR